MVVRRAATSAYIRRRFNGHKYRLRTPENVIGEIEYILENFPEVKEIVFEDDTFTINKSRVTEICNLLIQKGIHKKIRWLCNARVNLDCDTMVLMKKGRLSFDHSGYRKREPDDSE